MAHTPDPQRLCSLFPIHYRCLLILVLFSFLHIVLSTSLSRSLVAPPPPPPTSTPPSVNRQVCTCAKQAASNGALFACPSDGILNSFQYITLKSAVHSAQINCSSAIMTDRLFHRWMCSFVGFTDIGLLEF
jgi:hypothetical protein